LRSSLNHGDYNLPSMQINFDFNACSCSTPSKFNGGSTAGHSLPPDWRQNAASKKAGNRSLYQ
jgi:hypothetical protein